MFIMESSTKGFFDGVPSRTSFAFGVITGIAVVLIVSYLFGLPGTSGTSRTNARVAVDEAAVPTVAPTAQPSPAAAPAGPVPVVTDDDHVRGNPDAKLTFIEYSDFECPFCKSFTPTTAQMLDDYDGDVRLVYRHFPLSFHRPLALTQAEATECANEFKGNDAFWAMHDFIFSTTSSNGNGMTVEQLIAFAESLDISRSDFQTCLDDDRYVAHIEADLQSGSAAGVTGTPGSFFVDANGQAELISGAVPYAQIKAVIDAAL